MIEQPARIIQIRLGSNDWSPVPKKEQEKEEDGRRRGEEEEKVSPAQQAQQALGKTLQPADFDGGGRVFCCFCCRPWSPLV